MKIATAVLLFITAVSAVHAQQYPEAIGYVNDFANLLTHEQGTSLNDELIAFEKKTSIEIAVITVSSLEGQNIEDYTQGLARNWGVGKQHQDNGIVFLIAPKERQMRIEVASGVRSILTDSNADRIRDSVVLSSFRSGDMAQGIIDGAHSIMRTFDVSVELEVTEKKTQPTTSRKWTSEDTKIISYILGGFAVVMFIWRVSL